MNHSRQTAAAHASDGAPDVLPLSRAGWTIDEWCARYGFQRSLYYRMKDKPEAISIGRRIIITAEADRDWRERQRANAKKAPVKAPAKASV